MQQTRSQVREANVQRTGRARASMRAARRASLGSARRIRVVYGDARRWSRCYNPHAIDEPPATVAAGGFLHSGAIRGNARRRYRPS